MLAMLAVVVLLMGGAGLANAADIDGRVVSGEYTSSADLDVRIEGVSSPVSGAKLYWEMNGIDLDVAFVLPRSLVDTTYNDAQKAASLHDSWDTSPSGKYGHDYGDLKGSDKASIELLDKNGDTILNVVMDFLYESGGSWKSDLGGDGSKTGGTGAAQFKEGASSMTYNLVDQGWGATSNATKRSPNLTTAGGTPDRSEYYSVEETDWVYDVVYEFKISGSNNFLANFTPSATSILLGPDDPNIRDSAVIHVSPNKLGKNKIGTLPPEGGGAPPSSAVPLPSGAWMGMAMFGILGLARRIRRRRE
jgi:hypothetical protein